MNTLKALRTRLHMTQKQVAERLDTTQQTIQRWESGQTEIPAAHLKDLSILLGCRIEELLGVDTQTKRNAEGFARARHDLPWGTFKVSFSFGERLYPIDERERDALLERFHSQIDLKRQSGWVEFTTLDNRLVFLNPTFALKLDLVSDEEEEMPFFASPEAYRALTSAPLKKIGPVLQDECTGVLVSLNVADERGKPDMDKAAEKLNSLEVVTCNGQSSTPYLSDDVATSVFVLSDDGEIGPNTFLTVSVGDGNYEIVNLGNIAAIEVSVEAYLAHLAKDGDDA
ncbi:helix-turn-helix transcriptional regulator [Hyphomicrobium sp. D-2]|uniref:helix-turn-helix transcriptional regulator n=1 Tax=Hyphomicrobium sp. D-2 TaxID=3041621 RepID=UPI002458B39F|nr:helix-turn-helix transcriptional regulator [Hyphomicrobium sp. D-2]MDH4981873.1 helix-turn-helix transcriptional regulator [Hyphomicrobium sp. D-2]